MRERDVEHHLTRLAKLHGWYCRKIRFVACNGAPDRLLISPEGVAHWIELKRPGGTPRLRQKRELAVLEGYGQVVRVVDSIDQVERIFG